MIDIKRLESILKEDGIVFLTYGGFMSQDLIASMTEALEKESENAELTATQSNSIFTIFIELSQNIMNYSKSLIDKDRKLDPKGIIIVGRNDMDEYYILSQNVIAVDDKKRIEPKLKNITNTDLAGIKELYKKERKSGKGKHEKGGGIGFYEIAKRSLRIEYSFEPIDGDMFYFRFKAVL